MRPVVVSQTGIGNTAPVPLNQYSAPFNVGMGVTVVGTVTFTVQHTFDDIFNATVTPTWFNHPTLAVLSTNSDGNYAFPVRAIRLNVSAGTGQATLTIVQAGIS